MRYHCVIVTEKLWALLLLLLNVQVCETDDNVYPSQHVLHLTTSLQMEHGRLQNCISLCPCHSLPIGLDGYSVSF